MARKKNKTFSAPIQHHKLVEANLNQKIDKWLICETNLKNVNPKKMKTLLEDYQRKLATAEEMIETTKDTGSKNDIAKMSRLKTKVSEYRAFIVDIERTIKREEDEDSEPKTRLEKLETLSFADLKALQELCEDKMSHYQRRFPSNKKMHEEIYKEQYDLWAKWYGLNTAVNFVIHENVKKLNA